MEDPGRARRRRVRNCNDAGRGRRRNRPDDSGDEHDYDDGDRSRDSSPVQRGYSPASSPSSSSPEVSEHSQCLELCETPDDEAVLDALHRHGTYKVRKRVGYGTFSNVYLATMRKGAKASSARYRPGQDGHNNAKRLYAIKVVSSEVITKGEVVAGMVLRHPNISNMLEWFAMDDNYFLVFQYIDGADLQVLWSNEQVCRDATLFTEEHFRIVFLQALSCLTYCHSLGVVHRDVKLENIVVNDEAISQPRKTRATLVDFGFCFFCNPLETTLRPNELVKKHQDTGKYYRVRLDEKDVLCDANAFVGTEDYCAPELILGAISGPHDLFATDVYSLGVVLYCALVGRFPRGESFTKFLVNARKSWDGHPGKLLQDAEFRRQLNSHAMALDFSHVPSRKYGNRQSRRPLSADVKDLMRRMLHPLPASRLTLAQVRQHPWVSSVGMSSLRGRKRE